MPDNLTTDMHWYYYQKKGWSWTVGWVQTRNGYCAQAWKNLKTRKKVGGRWTYRQCLTESGKTIAEASSKLLQRLDGLEKKDE